MPEIRIQKLKTFAQEYSATLKARFDAASRQMQSVYSATATEAAQEEFFL